MFRIFHKNMESAGTSSKQEAYRKAIARVEELLGTTSRPDEQGAILDYAIKVVKRDLIGEALSNIFYCGNEFPPDWRNVIPVPFSCQEKKPVSIDLGSTDVLAVPWRVESLATSIRDLRTAPFNSAEGRYSASYYKEIGLAVINNGIHHSAVASMGGGGAIQAAAYSMAAAFNIMSTNGAVWTIKEQQGTSQIDVLDFRFAILFTLAEKRHKISQTAFASANIDTRSLASYNNIHTGTVELEEGRSFDDT